MKYILQFIVIVILCLILLVAYTYAAVVSIWDFNPKRFRRARLSITRNFPFKEQAFNFLDA